MDETTHPLSPKVLDRAHVMRFRNPVLLDWDAMAAEVEDSPEDSEPVILRPTDLAPRTDYPAFEPDDPVTSLLLRIARDFLDPIGVEFGLRAIRQSLGYINHAKAAGLPADAALNNVMLHKVLPKIAFDAGRKVADGRTRIDVLRDLAGVLRKENGNPIGVSEDAANALDRMILAAGNNNDVVNFWSR